MNLIESLKAHLTPNLITGVSEYLGESELAVKKGFDAAIPTILGGILHASSNKSTMDQIWDLINQMDNEPSSLENLFELNASESFGNSLLEILTGQKNQAVTAALASFADFKSEASSAKILTLVASFVLNYLKKKVLSEDYGISGLTTWLGGHKNEIQTSVPSSIFSILNLGNPGEMVEVIKSSQPQEFIQTGNNWIMWLIGLLALLSFLWLVMKGCNKNERTDKVGSTVMTVDSTSMKTAELNKNASSQISGIDSIIQAKWALLGNMTKLSLPGGVEINFPENGVEGRLVNFIKDKNKKIDKTTWFDFDRILFESGSSNLNPASINQINNITSILKTFPDVQVKVGGYTDNVGDPIANKKLSQNRAESVTSALVANGIEAKRMEAEGYGQEHPVADNNTETGRDLNRRVSLRVTKK
ncbi:MAG: OmpA family protein [Saprospiraceae bacterium]|nr:OmpA family protein [Candidatus Vicinibacter affinis]